MEANNDLVQVVREEEGEVLRILAALTDRVRAALPELEALVAGIGALDLVFARGGLAERMEAVEPVIGEEREVVLRGARNPLLLKRFEQEFKAASLIDHPNVVKALDYSGTGPTPFLVMEFVDGETLGQRVEREGPMPEAEAVKAVAQVCEGLHRAHKQGMIHRDVKPDNVMITHDGVVKLTDLGLVKEIEGEQNLTRTGRGLGTPHFMAPEQFRNAKAADVIDSDAKVAEGLLREALTADIFFGPAHNNLGVLFLKEGKLYEAAEEFEWARKLMPGHPDPRMNLALTLEQAGRVDEAIKTYETALEVYPGHIATTQALARLHVQSGRKNGELAGWLDVIALQGETAEWREWAAEQQMRSR